MTNSLVRDDPFPAHIAFFVVARFSFAFALAVDLSFALALIVILALSFALALVVALAFALVFALAYVVHVHRSCFSEVIHDPRLVRVQVSLDDCSQLVVVTLKLLRVHQQMVSQFLWAFSQHHADLHVVRRCPSDVPTAQLAASRISDPRFSARSLPPSVSTLRPHFCSALFAPVSSFVPWSVSPAKRTVCDSMFGWSQLILPFPSECSPQAETLRPAGVPRISHPPR